MTNSNLSKLLFEWNSKDPKEEESDPIELLESSIRSLAFWSPFKLRGPKDRRNPIWTLSWEAEYRKREWWEIGPMGSMSTWWPFLSKATKSLLIISFYLARDLLDPEFKLDVSPLDQGFSEIDCLSVRICNSLLRSLSLSLAFSLCLSNVNSTLMCLARN